MKTNFSFQVLIGFILSTSLIFGNAPSLFETFPFFESVLNELPEFYGDVSIKFMDSGIGNHVFKISNLSSGQSYALKIFSSKNYRKIFDTYSLFEELRPSFEAAGIQTPRTCYLPFIQDDEILMVNEFVIGIPITDEQLPKTGGVMASLHQIPLSNRTLDKPYDMDFYFAQCSEWKACAHLKKIWDSLDDSYLEFLPKGLIHGDFSYSNILIDEDENLTLIDWDKMRYSYLIDDIALAQIYYGFDDEGYFKKDLFKSFMESYQKVRPLKTIEKTSLITHIKRRLIEIALIMHYHLYIDPQGPIDGVAGDLAQLKRIQENKDNHFIDPNFMEMGIRSLDCIANDDFWQYEEDLLYYLYD